MAYKSVWRLFLAGLPGLRPGSMNMVGAKTGVTRSSGSVAPPAPTASPPFVEDVAEVANAGPKNLTASANVRGKRRVSISRSYSSARGRRLTQRFNGLVVAVPHPTRLHRTSGSSFGASTPSTMTANAVLFTNTERAAVKTSVFMVLCSKRFSAF